MVNWGRIDGAVCVAGILRERMLFNMSEEEFDDVVRVHLKGTFTVYRAASAVMRKQEGGGSLVAFTSGVWALGSTAQPNYAAAKGGIVSLTYSAAVALERYGVRANVVAPVPPAIPWIAITTPSRSCAVLRGAAAASCAASTGVGSGMRIRWIAASSSFSGKG
jgi:NAD(P)-dependent dehydrogenase (short-subunit alcohol dehydrogenase family)